MSYGHKRNNDFNNATDFMKHVNETVTKIIMAILEYLEKEEEHAKDKELARWIRDNKGRMCVNIYPIRGKRDNDEFGCSDNPFDKDIINALKVELDKNRISYKDLCNGNILIRDVDYKKVNDINTKLCIATSKYYQETSRSELEDAIARFDKIKNKNILTVTCEDFIEAEVLKRKCNAIASGFMVGISRTVENKFNVSVHSAKLIDINQRGKDFCKAYLEMTLSLHGANRVTKRKQIIDDKSMDKQISELKYSNETQYIISATDNTKYIELNDRGFSYIETVTDKDGFRHDSKKGFCRRDNPDYELELERFKACLYNKVIIDSPDDLSKHLQTAKVNFYSDRTRKTKKEYEISLMEKRLADKIDSMIKTKWKEEKEKEILTLNPRIVFNEYKKECLVIMEAIMKDEKPIGYKEDDFENLMDICMDSNIIFEDEYKKTVECIKNAEAKVNVARKQDRNIVQESRREIVAKDENSDR